MSQVFDSGGWLDTGTGGPWRRYGRMPEIVTPVKTWVLVDEHPDSLNDAACAVAMFSPGTPDGTVRIVDFPASYHNGACGLAFADGHSEIHQWKGATMKAPVRFRDGVLTLNVPAGDHFSALDVLWWAERTTTNVKNGTWE